MNKTTEALKNINWFAIISTTIMAFVLSPILIGGIKVLIAAIKWSWNVEVSFDD